MIDLKLWAQAQRAAGIEATEEQVHACYEQLMQEQDVVRAKGAPRVVNDAVMATWSDAARKAAAEARHNGIHGETVKPGEMVKFHTPGDDHEAKHHMHVVEDRGDRVLVQHNSGFEHMKIKPQSVISKSDLMRHHVTASEILAQKRAEIIRGGAPVGNKNAAGHGHVTPTAYVCPNCKGHYSSLKAKTSNDHCYQCNPSKPKQGMGEFFGRADVQTQQAIQKTNHPDSPAHKEAAAKILSLAKEIGAEHYFASDHDMDADVVRCRAQLSTAPVTAQDKPWKQGEPVTFTYMPAGLHTITAGFRKGSVNLTVLVDEDAARAAQRSYDAWRERMPKQKLYGCVEHREQEASVIAKGFSWQNGEGVVISAEPTALGEQNVNGKIHWGWSPSFMTDADYSKAVERPPESGQLVFPDGVRGSGSNPARITGISRCVGTLTNNPAFHEMPPVKASEVVQASGTSEGVRKSWETRKGGAIHITEPGQKIVTVAYRQVHGAAKAYSYNGAKVYESFVGKDGALKARPVYEHGPDRRSEKLAEEDAIEHAKQKGHPFEHGIRQGFVFNPKYGEEQDAKLEQKRENIYNKGSDAIVSDSVKASGTSEGVAKSWEARHGELMGKSATHQAKASEHETNASHHDDLNNGSLANHHVKIAQHHQQAAEHYEAAAEHAKAGNDVESDKCEANAERHASRADSMKAADATPAPDKVTASSILKSIKDRAVRASEILRPKFVGRLTGNVVQAAGTSEGVKKSWETRKANIGDHVKVADGSGLDSGKEGVVVHRSEVKTDGRGNPTNVEGAYKPIDHSREHVIKLHSNGKLISMFHNRVMVKSKD